MATLLRGNIIKANEDFKINLAKKEAIQIFKDQEFTIEEIYSFPHIEITDKDNNIIPFVVTLKELPEQARLPMDVILERFTDALDVDVIEYFNHDKEHISNRIKKYYDKA